MWARTGRPIFSWWGWRIRGRAPGPAVQQTSARVRRRSEQVLTCAGAPHTFARHPPRPPFSLCWLLRVRFLQTAGWAGVPPSAPRATAGVGSYGRVKLGRREDTGEEVAVKILEKRAIQKPDVVRREIAIMKALNHENVVKLRDVLASRSRLYIVMELVRGGELFDRIGMGRGLDEATARAYFTQLVDGMVYCHARGVYHRDIKPENVLVDEHGVLKIADFGVSSMAGSEDLLYSAVGSPSYCAPEVLGGAQEGYSGVKVDAWSCGVLLYVLITGRLPFHDDDQRRLLALLIECKVPYPAWMGGAVKDLIGHLLVADPAARLSLEDVRQHPWLCRGSNDGNKHGNDGGGSTPTIRKLEATYAGRGVRAFVADAMSGKPRHKVDDMVRLLSDHDIDCVDDLQTLAETMGSAERMSEWLHSHAEIPHITAMRFSRSRSGTDETNQKTTSRTPSPPPQMIPFSAPLTPSPCMHRPLPYR